MLFSVVRVTSQTVALSSLPGYRLRLARRLTFSLFAQRESKQRESAPDIRPQALCTWGSLAQSVLQGPLRRAVHGPSQLSRHPCRSTPYTPIPLTLLTGLLDRADTEDSVATKRPFEKADRRCCAAGFEAGCRESASGPWMALWRAPAKRHRSEGTRRTAPGRIVGQAFLVTFVPAGQGATGKSDPPSRAEQMLQRFTQIVDAQITQCIGLPIR